MIFILYPINLFIRLINRGMKRKISCLMILLSMFGLSILSRTQAAQVNWDKLVEFRNTAAPNSYEEEKLSEKNLKLLPWEEYEKNNVLKMLKAFHKTAPGLIENPALYGPIPCYRADEKTARGMGVPLEKKWVAFALAGSSAWFSDMFSSEDWTTGASTVIHEFTHLVDVGDKISRSVEFRKLVEPRILKARAEIKKAGLFVREPNEDTNKITKGAGLPRTYAATSLQEALACYSPDVFVGKESATPSEIGAFIKSHVFTKAPSIDRSIIPYRQAIVLYEKNKYDEAMLLINEALRLDPDFVDAYYFRALILNSKGDNEGAIKEFTHLLSLLSECDGVHASILYKRGSLYVKKGDLEKGLADYNEAIEKHPDEPQPYYYRALVWNQKKEYDKAIADLNEALKIYPDYANVYLERGLSKYNKNDIDAAIADFDLAIKSFPEYGSAYYFKGMCRLSKKEYDDALVDLSTAIKLNPKNAEAYAVRGDCEIEKKYFDRAIEDYTEAIKLKTGYAYAYYKRGISRANNKETESALGDFNEAIKINPRYSQVYFTRAGIMLSRKEYDKAVADYNEYLKINPESKNASVYYSRGLALQEKGEYDKAIEDFSSAIKLRPENASIYTDRGRLWHKKKEYNKAIDDFNESLKLAPSELLVYHYRGWSWLEKGEPDRAINDFDAAKGRMPFDIAENHYPRGLALLKKKEYDAALSEFDQAINLFPKDARIYCSRGEAWTAKKEYTKAITDYDLAISLDSKSKEAHAKREELERYKTGK